MVTPMDKTGVHYGGFELNPACGADQSSSACPVVPRVALAFKQLQQIAMIFALILWDFANLANGVWIVQKNSAI